jgi:uncharacterized protein YbaR (Trm112 family)
MDLNKHGEIVSDDCPECGKPIKLDWVACPACGAHLKQIGARETKTPLDKFMCPACGGRATAKDGAVWQESWGVFVHSYCLSHLGSQRPPPPYRHTCPGCGEAATGNMGYSPATGHVFGQETVLCPDCKAFVHRACMTVGEIIQEPEKGSWSRREQFGSQSLKCPVCGRVIARQSISPSGALLAVQAV